MTVFAAKHARHIKGGMHPSMIWYALEFNFLFYFSISNKKRKQEHLPNFAVSPASD